MPDHQLAPNAAHVLPSHAILAPVADAWQRLLAWVRQAMAESPPTWREMAGAALIVVMLVSFYSVVSGAARQAEANHRVDAAQAEAALYCRGLPSQRERANCMVQLGVDRAGDNK